MAPNYQYLFIGILYAKISSVYKMYKKESISAFTILKTMKYEDDTSIWTESAQCFRSFVG